MTYLCTNILPKAFCASLEKLFGTATAIKNNIALSVWNDRRPRKENNKSVN